MRKGTKCFLNVMSVAQNEVQYRYFYMYGTVKLELKMLPGILTIWGINKLY